jgi:hypothetical protein
MAGLMTIFIFSMKVTLFDSDVSDRDSESDSNNVVSAVTFILHLFPKRRNECKWTPYTPTQ